MRVLLIENHRLLARPLTQGLEEDGYSVVHVCTGAEGEYEASLGRYDAIILNPSLPEGDGLQRLQKWRHGGINIPVMVITSNASPSDRSRAINLGANDYLTLPFDLSQLFLRLRALIAAFHEGTLFIVRPGWQPRI
jgi:DNA-binding response OmpR family regulator